MRTEESHQRAKRYADIIDDELLPPHAVIGNYPKYLAKLGVMFRLPIIEWSAQAVFEYLGDDINPLYKDFDRVGCFPCLAGGDIWKEKAFAYDDFGRSQREKCVHLKSNLTEVYLQARAVNVVMMKVNFA